MADWTVQTLIDGDMHIKAYCHNSRCHHRQSLDLAKLRDKLGPDAPAMAGDLIPKLKCAKCGGKKVGLIYSPASNEKLGWGGAHNRGLMEISVFLT